MQWAGSLVQRGPENWGNIGIAGHRDGFFRNLGQIKVGDAVELRTRKGAATYVVDQIRIVNPENVEVLRQRAVPSLTLVTCYPFHFIGSAPQRYVVMASLTHESGSGSASSLPDSGRLTNHSKEEK
ncbi:MAG: class D sortase [Terracidiphilus sp.]